MKANVKLYRYDGKTGGQYPVKLVVTHRQKIKRQTIARAFLEDWDEEKQLPKNTHPHYESLFAEIARIRMKAGAPEFMRLDDLEAAQIFLLKKKDPFESPRGDFYAFADQQIALMKQLGREGNAVAYQFTVDQLRKFAPTLELGQINRYLLENFKQFKKAEGLKNTSVRTYLYEIRALYNKAVRLGLVEDQRPFAGIFADLPVRKRRYKTRYLDQAGLKTLMEIKGVSVAQQQAVDLALLQFYLGGVDLVDLYHLKKDQLRGGRVYLMRQKLGAKGYTFDLALLKPAVVLLEKYKAPTGPWWFPWSKDRTRYQTFRANFNAKLKRVQKNTGIEVLPTGGALTSKVIRHTFATLGKFHHLDPDLLRELMGHERNEIDTIYKDKYPEAERDEALKKICLF